MTEKKDEKPEILLDADVFSHFLKGSTLNILPKIFPKRLCIVDRVKIELNRWKIKPVEEFIKKHKIKELSFPSEDMDILYEYSKLQSEGFGDGESAILSIARYKKKYIASSNLKDVKKYCEEHKIVNYPTMELLHLAKQKGFITEKEINNFLGEVIKKGSILPYTTYKEYLAKERK